jgi:hypothetical protein
MQNTDELNAVSPAPRLTMSFFRGLIAGPGGTPDESALAFLALIVTHIGLEIASVFRPALHYDAAVFVTASTGLLAFYQASIRIRGNQ